MFNTSIRAQTVALVAGSLLLLTLIAPWQSRVWIALLPSR